MMILDGLRAAAATQMTSMEVVGEVGRGGAEIEAAHILGFSRFYLS